MDITQESDVRWRIDATGDMHVPGIVFATKDLMDQIRDDASLTQVANVAHLPGIVEASYAMPDIHWGYGFPIGGVAATDVDEGGVVSPGGVGFDISCGVRLHTVPMTVDEFAPRLQEVLDVLDRTIPRGLGKGAVWDLSRREDMDRVLTDGARFAVERGYGTPADLARIEDGGTVPDADPGQVSSRAIERGAHQVGSLGSGNHFLEIQTVSDVYDAEAAAFGLEAGQVCVMIHTGSRGLGHQVCQDHVRTMQRSMREHGIHVPDRQLACVPVDSSAGRAYLGAMAASANFGRANRQLLGEAARDAFATACGIRDLPLLYDVSHNLAKLEEHEVGGRRRRLCVHRKGATLALPPGHPALHPEVRATGQPVLVPGSMGTGSHVMVGTAGGAAWYSSCHGAGRTMSRTQAKRQTSGAALRAALLERGIETRPGSERDLPEEAPYAYKDVDAVVETCERADLARRVVRVRPVGVVKG